MQTDWEILQSKTIDWLRFPMAVAVVMLHYSKYVFPESEGALHFLCILFQEGLCRLAVPCFFFISGFLFFSKLEEKWDWRIWQDKMGKRFRTLLIPYLLWNLIAFFALWLYTRATGDSASLSQEFVNRGGIKMFWSVTGGIPVGSQAYPVDGPLWFIRDLILYIVLTPVVFIFIRWTKIYGLLVLAMAYLAVNRLVPEGFLFFVSGAFFRLEKMNIVETLYPVRGWLYVVALLSLTGLVLIQYNSDSDFWKKLIKFVFLLSGIGSSFSGAASLLHTGRTRVLPFLAGSSFFIFAAHEVLILQQIATLAVQLLVPQTPLGACLAFFVIPVFTVAICLGLLFVLQRLLPRFTGLLTGSRKIKNAYR